ncbi:CotY/CotZ family spore coat protein [Alkalihalobacillus deserti]|uniref:CotY/CotZ family spore coat protein n=1 Tax=Alkalihalobacillus deserti TaxID=2879466 RepID=UPI001D133312|nr:CotY/CotZ family spore coat protein [Alkalihalobacillus deserti]
MYEEECLKSSNCILKTALKIDRVQKKHKYCSCNITIPIILLNKNLKPFEAFGNIGDLQNDCYGCFKTNIFKIIEFGKSSGCGKLLMLRPIDENGCLANTICETFRLEKTPFSVDVDFNCFCAIQHLSRSLVNRPLPFIEHKC